MNTNRGVCERLRTVLAQPLPEAALAGLIAEHVAVCPDCRRADALLRSLASELRDAPPATLPPEVEARLLARLCDATGAAPRSC